MPSVVLCEAQPRIPIRHGGTMSDPISEDRSEFGVLFVAGFAEQRPGAAIATFAGAVYHWLFRWNARPYLRSGPPALSKTVLDSAPGADGGPAHVTLAVPLHLNTGEHDARWLLAESSWADLFSPPRFLGVARWIWKVSTCLLVLQFVIPMQRHWNRAKRTDKPWDRRLADGVVAPCYLVLMAVAAMASVLLSLALLALAVVEKLPIPRIDKAVQWAAVKISAVLGDSYMLAHCPVQFAAMRTQVPATCTGSRIAARGSRSWRTPRVRLSPIRSSKTAAISEATCERSSPSGKGSPNSTCSSAWTGTRMCTGRHGGAVCSSPPGCSSPGCPLLACSYIAGPVPRSSTPW